MKSILWCILSADVAAWTADRQKGHPSPFVIAVVVAGATVQLSEGHCNKSLSPSGPLVEGRDPRVRAGQRTERLPGVHERVETKGMKGK